MKISKLPSSEETRVNSFVEAVSSNQSNGLSEESVSTYLSSSVCDKPLAPGYLPKWRGLGGCLCREFCYSIPQLNEIIYHNKRGSAVRLPRLLPCTCTGTKALLCLCRPWTGCAVQPSAWRWDRIAQCPQLAVKDLSKCWGNNFLLLFLRFLIG